MKDGWRGALVCGTAALFHADTPGSKRNTTLNIPAQVDVTAVTGKNLEFQDEDS
jgi:hypothetical protein